MLTEADIPEAGENWKLETDTPSNKRRAAPASSTTQPYQKSRSKRGDDGPRFTAGGGRGNLESERKKEDLVDVEHTKGLKKLIGDPFDERVLHIST